MMELLLIFSYFLISILGWRQLGNLIWSSKSPSRKSPEEKIIRQKTLRTPERVMWGFMIKFLSPSTRQVDDEEKRKLYFGLYQKIIHLTYKVVGDCNGTLI